MKIKYLAYLLIVMLAFSACESDLDALTDPYTQEFSGTTQTPSYSSGTADFSRYVAIGNSLTAGFSDGALFIEGQEVSFTNLLAKQFSLAGGGSFTQPLMSDNVGGLLFNGTPNPSFGPRLIFDPVNQAPVLVSGTPSTDVFDLQPGPYNNMGVPGVKVSHVLFNGLGNPANLGVSANPYYVRMASAPNATILGDALALNPTFFSLWLGNNDVLGYASNGGDMDLDQITPLVDFQNAFNAVVQQLSSTGAQGVMANIPNVTDAPYFTTVPHAPLDPTNSSFGPLIPQLNTVFGALNGVYAFLGVPERSIVFSETSASAVVIRDESLANISAQITAVLNADPNFPLFVQSLGLPAAAAPLAANLLGQIYGQSRQATPSDLLVLPSSSIIGTVNEGSLNNLIALGLPQDLAAQFSVEGVTLPLADRWVLIPDELDEISQATDQFNQVIADAATNFDIPLFDVNTFFNEVATSGFQAGSAFMTADFVTGGTFSLDGIHPSPRGNTVVVNQMIDIINATYGSNLPTLNPVDYTGLYLD